MITSKAFMKFSNLVTFAGLPSPSVSQKRAYTVNLLTSFLAATS